MAENGEIALDMMGSGRYGLILMDMQMPVMDGVTATREIRKMARGATIPIVAMTANAMERDRRRCAEAGMDDFLAKPFEPAALMAILLRWLQAAAEAESRAD